MAWLLVGCVITLFAASAVTATEPMPASWKAPISAEDSLRHFALAEDLAIEIAAAEPEVIDPIAIRFDERGRMWVVEMRDYPTGPVNGQPPQSRIRVLTDEDHDGRFEKSVTFAEQLVFPTGLQPWNGGVIVTIAGRIAFFKDTDGDGKADVDETWYTGFAEENTQLRANHPRLGIDGWIYVANGLRGGRIRNARKPEQPEIVLNGMDFRFHPLTGECEAITGNGQFGMTFDDFGHRFVCSNRNPLEHVVLENWQIARAPGVPIAKVMQTVAAAGEQSRIYPLSRAWTTSNLHAGQFTAACGCLIFRSTALPERFQPRYDPLKYSAFICDPTANLVHWEVVQRDGASFAAKPGLENKEFLASPDEWFRPVNLEVGPDGALYVVDMYRAVIEHPDWVPEELKRRPDERLGNDQGRIYRIAAKQRSAEQQSWGLKLAGKDTAATVALLTDALQAKDGWMRDTAARLLWEDETLRLAAVEPLKRLIATAPQGQLPDVETPPYVVQARELVRPIRSGLKHEQTILRDWSLPIALVDEHVVQRMNAEAESVDDFFSVLSHSRPEVVFQSLLIPTKELTDNDYRALLRTAEKHGSDPWFRTAIQMATADVSGKLLLRMLLSERTLDSELLLSLAERTGQRGSNETALEALRQWQHRLDDKHRTTTFECIARLGLGLSKRQQTLTGIETDEDNFVGELNAEAVKSAEDDTAAINERLAAIQMLAFVSEEEATLVRLWQRDPPTELQAGLIAALDRSASNDHWAMLLDAAARMTPAVRQVLLDLTLRQNERVALLLDRLENQQFRLAELDPAQTSRLANLKVPTLQDRVNKLLASSMPADRVAVLKDYQPALKQTGDPQLGRIVFEKNCATCHRVGGIGVNVAPDISDSRTKTTAQLLTDILQPNRAIDANFVAYAVALTDGTVLSGILATETSASITLRQPGDKTLVIPRGEIEELRSLGVSLMPEGLEKNIPVEGMADLLAYLKNWRYLDGLTPLGN